MPLFRTKRYITCSLLAWTICSWPLFAQVNPALPNTAGLITCFPDTAGYAIITVGPVGRDYTDLQEAIDAVSPGTVIILDAGEPFVGGFQLPDKGPGEEWIILMSSRMDLLPDDATRVDPAALTGDLLFPTQRDAMPGIVTNHPSGIPCFRTQPGAHHYRLVGLEITADSNVLNSYGLVNLGESSSAQNELSEVPHHLVIDRCYIHGHDRADIIKYGIRLDCAYGAVMDSYVAQFHSVGFDAQAISGINGPGPFKIINNYLEASGENILFGGGAPAIPGLVPADIEIRQNYFYKPWSWRVGHPAYAGKHWTIKNLFELKTGKRVWLDGNVLENCWADLPTGQSGYAILLTVRTEGGASPQADVSDILITNNIIRHAGAGISLSGTDGAGSNRSSRIRISNNLFDDISGPAYGDLNTAGPNDGTYLKIGDPQEVWIDHNTVFHTGPITWAYGITDSFLFTDNITNSLVSAGGYQGIYGPGYQQGNATIAHYFPDITDANRHFDHNVLIGGNASRYTMFNTVSHNFFPPDVASVGFVNAADGLVDYHGYRLLEDSPFAGISGGGTDPGLNIDSLDVAMTRDRGCQDIMSEVLLLTADKPSCKVYPNPASGILYMEGNSSAISHYTIHDCSGRVWCKGVWSTPVTSLDISLLHPGIYILEITSSTGRSGYRVLKL